MSRGIRVKNVKSDAEFILKDKNHMKRFLILTYGICPKTYTDLIGRKIPYKETYKFEYIRKEAIMYKIKFDFYKFKWKITNIPLLWFDSRKQAKIYLKNL